MLTDYFDFDEHVFIKSKSDIEEIKESSRYRPIGYVEVYNKKTKKLILKGFNKVMISASEFMALHMFNNPAENYITPTYNTYIGSPEGLDQTHTDTGNDLTLDYKICLFCMGTSGCSRGSQIKYEVSNKGWIKPEDLVPFKYVGMHEDLGELARRIYFGKKTLVDYNRIAYYFKRFDSNAVLKREYEDGTDWTSEIYQDDSTMRANVKIGITFSIDEEDGRDYFDRTTGINDARFNTIELLAGWPEVIDGFTYYQDVRPFTRLNMPNKYLSSAGDSYEFRYFLYF